MLPTGWKLLGLFLLGGKRPFFMQISGDVSMILYSPQGGCDENFSELGIIHLSVAQLEADMVDWQT